MIRKTLKRSAFAAVAVMMTFHSAMAEQECAAGVSSALDKQREAYIQAQADMAQQNYSTRPGSFASTTCLDKLMTSGGLDIFFKPPSLDNIINMVKNLACEQASQIFESLVGGSGLNAGTLNPGEILGGLNLGGNLLGSMGSGQGAGGLIGSLIGSATNTGNTNPTSDITNSLQSVFK